MRKGFFDVLTDEEMEHVVPISKEEIDEALEKGRQDMESCEKYRESHTPSSHLYR
jgi:hypothetical protein